MLVLPLVAWLSLGAAPQVKLAAAGFSSVGVEPAMVELCSDHLAQQLVLHGIAVTTRSELGALIGLERQRELLGCSSNGGSCLAELSGALGVDGLITGSVAKLADGWLVNVKIVSTQDGSALAAASLRAKRDAEIVDWLTSIAPEMAERLKSRKSGAPAAEVGASGGVRGKSWIPFVAGGVFALAGAGALANAFVIDGQIRGGASQFTQDPSQTATRLNSAVQQGYLSQTLAWVGFGVAAACFAAGAGMYLFGAEAPRVAAVLTAHGAWAGVEVPLP